MVRAAVLVAMILAGACAPRPDVGLGGVAPATVAPSDGETAWTYLATVEGSLPGRAAAAGVESQPALAAAWDEHGFAGRAPAVDFDRRFVLLLGQPDDACVDALVGLEVVGGELRPDWLPPPGGCAQPLIFRIHAVAIDRRFVPSRFEVAFEPPFETDAERVSIEVATLEGTPPSQPQPPASMGDDDLAAVFAGHDVRRCAKEDFRPVDGPIDLPRSDMSDNDAMRLMDRVREWLRHEGYRSNVDFVPFLDRRSGVRPALWVDGRAAGQVRRKVDEFWGAGAVLVEANGYDFEAVDTAQRDLGAITGAVPYGEPGSISSTTGIPGPVVIGMIDPTREALDLVAATVDPSLVCIDPQLSGVGAEVGTP